MLVELNRKQNNLLLSFIILALLTSIIIFVFYPSTSKLGNTFDLAVAFLFSRYFGLYIGVALILLRILRVLKNNNTLIYIFIGLLNISLGILSLVLAVSNNMDSSVFNLIIVNEVVGAIIFMDIMVLNSK